MNVGELRKELAKYDDDVEIHLYCDMQTLGDEVLQMPTGVKQSGNVVLLGYMNYGGIVKDVQWDRGDEIERDFEAANLPSEVYIPMDVINEDDDGIIDWLSDTYYWLISGCTIERWC